MVKKKKERCLTDLFYSITSTCLHTCVLECVLPPLGGYLSLMAGSQLAWHRLAKERTSEMPNTQPHTPSSSSRMKLYSGHNARHGPRHLGEWKDALQFKKKKIYTYILKYIQYIYLFTHFNMIHIHRGNFLKSRRLLYCLFLSLTLKHTPVSYDIWMSSTGHLATLSPQVKLAHHPIQFHLHKYKKWF